MRLAVTELRRARGRFVAVGTALTLIAVLVLLLGGLLDGLVRGSTGLLRAQDGELIVYAADARQTLDRSVLDADTRDAVAATAGVADVVPFGAVVVTATSPAADDLVTVAVVGHDARIGPVRAPSDDDRVVVDARLSEAGIAPGDPLTLPDGRTVTVAEEVRDVATSLQPTVWLPLEAWRAVAAAARPDTALGDDGVQALAVTVDADAEAADVAAAIDAATGTTETLTVADAIDALPGVSEQTATFSAIIGATLLVAGLVVALFFALLTLERAPLYAVLKALGASTARLAVTVTVQAVLIALAAATVAGALTLGLAAVVPDGVPVELRWSRAGLAVAGLVATAALGAAASLRRLTRIDPAEAIG